MVAERNPGGDRNDLDPAGFGSPRTGGRAREVGQYVGHGLTLGLAALLFAWLGHLLDGRLSTSPLFVLLGVFVGFGAGFYSMYRRLTDTLAGDGDAASGGDGTERGP